MGRARRCKTDDAGCPRAISSGILGQLRSCLGIVEALPGMKVALPSARPNSGSKEKVRRLSARGGGGEARLHCSCQVAIAQIEKLTLYSKVVSTS